MSINQHNNHGLSATDSTDAANFSTPALAGSTTIISPSLSGAHVAGSADSPTAGADAGTPAGPTGSPDAAKNVNVQMVTDLYHRAKRVNQLKPLHPPRKALAQRVTTPAAIDTAGYNLNS